MKDNPAKLFFYRKITKAGREDKLTSLIRRYATGSLKESQLLLELDNLYNRKGSERTTFPPVSPPKEAGILFSSPLYLQIHSLVTQSFPRRDGLRADQIDSYANTASARATSLERLQEYQSRNVEYVKVVDFLDDATTDICRMMHGRIFPVENASQSINNQQTLAHPESFWEGNNHFAQTPTDAMEPWLPPYHYNCRTRVVPYIQPSNPYDAALDRYNNLIKLSENDISALVNKAAALEFDSRTKLFEHLSDHKDKLGISTQKQYLSLVSDLLKNPLKQMAMAVSARDGSHNFYVWNPKVRMIEGMQKHDFAVFSLDKNCLKTFHPKSYEDIRKNLDPKLHGKVMLLTNQYISKGADMAITDYDVKCYELILKYFETDDSCDELEMFSRLRFEEEWAAIPEPLKQRILAVDKLVLDKYVDYFDYNVFNEYIKAIRSRQQLETMREES